jgi:ABC-type transporter Mla maintaining outer membrane lipid asymmetry ATPase subunit MlaF
MLLDEPTTGLDPLMEQVFRDCVIEARDPWPNRVVVVARLERGRSSL